MTCWQFVWQGIWFAVAIGLTAGLGLGLVAVWSSMKPPQPPKKRRSF